MFEVETETNCFPGCQQMQEGGIQESPEWGVSYRSDLSVLCRALLFIHVVCRINNEQTFTQSTEWIIFVCKKIKWNPHCRKLIICSVREIKNYIRFIKAQYKSLSGHRFWPDLTWLTDRCNIFCWLVHLLYPKCFQRYSNSLFSHLAVFTFHCLYCALVVDHDYALCSLHKIQNTWTH